MVLLSSTPRSKRRKISINSTNILFTKRTIIHFLGLLRLSNEIRSSSHPVGIVRNVQKFYWKIYIESSRPISFQMFSSSKHRLDEYSFFFIHERLIDRFVFFLCLGTTFGKQPLQRDNEIIVAEDDQEFLSKLQSTLNRSSSPTKVLLLTLLDISIVHWWFFFQEEASLQTTPKVTNSNSGSMPITRPRVRQI